MDCWRESTVSTEKNQTYTNSGLAIKIFPWWWVIFYEREGREVLVISDRPTSEKIR